MGSRIQEQEISQISNQEQGSSNKHQQDNTKAGRTSYQKIKSAHIGILWKKLVITMNDGTHAQLLSKLRYDSLKQKTFFKKIILAYLDDNPLMRDLILDINKEKISPRQRKKMKEDQISKKETIRDFALDESDIDSIFDAIEKENPDI